MRELKDATQYPISETVENTHNTQQKLIYQFFDEAAASNACETLSFLFNKFIASGEFDSTCIRHQDIAFDVNRISNFIVKLQEATEE
jgi:hypothetical protein